MKRLNYFFVKKNIKLIPKYFKLKKAIKNKNLDFFRIFANEIIETSKISLTVEGLEHLENLNKFVLFSNHKSYYDPLFIFKSLEGFKLAFVQKEELKKIKLFRDFSNLTNSEFLDRENPKKALKTIIKLNELLKNENHQAVLIFPEGTRNFTNKLLEFKPGSFKLGTKEKVAIVPVVIKNANNIDNNSNKVSVILKYLKPILYDDYKNLKTLELANLVQTKIQEELNKEV